MWPIILIFGIYKVTASTQLLSRVGPNWPKGCWEMGERKENRHIQTALFYNMESEPCNLSSWFSGFIKPLSVSTFMPILMKIYTAVAVEKGIWNRRDGHTICFHSTKSVICKQSSCFSGFIKPLTVPNFLPGLVYISQAVAEKWVKELRKKEAF